MEIAFWYLLFVLGLNVFFCLAFRLKFFWNYIYNEDNCNFAQFISWLNVIVGGIFIVGFFTVKIYSLI